MARKRTKARAVGAQTSGFRGLEHHLGGAHVGPADRHQNLGRVVATTTFVGYESWDGAF